METRIDRLKKTLRRHAPAVITTATVTAIAVLALTRKGEEGWTALTLDQDQRDAMAKSDNITVVFEEAKTLVLGKPWNPES